MRSQQHSKYLTIAFYCIGAILTVFIVIWAFLNFATIWGYLAILLKTLWILFKPLTIGFIIAYILDPMVTFYLGKCQFKNQNRWGRYARLMATGLTFLTVICLIALFGLVVTLNVKSVLGAGTLGNFVDNVKYYFEYFQTTLNRVLETLERVVPSHTVQTIVNAGYGQFAMKTSELSMSSIAAVQKVGSNCLNIGLGCVIAFYLLKDKDGLILIWDNILKKITSRKIGVEIHHIGHDVDYVFSGYIRGQLIDAAIMGILTSLVLTLVRLDFAIIIGVISGIFNIIPYFGPLVGVALSGAIGLMGGEPTKALIAMGAVFVLQQLDGWFIVPKVMKESVKLHPIVVLLAIVIGGQLWGFAGILLGIPVAALIRCLIIRYIGDIFSIKKQES
ncbi:MAG: AI-2E family transporter [Cellulosilyticaceae bacterium]